MSVEREYSQEFWNKERIPIKKKNPWYNQRTADLTPAEKEIRKENLEARKHMSDEGIKHLYAAVALQAVKDYERTRKRKNSAIAQECRDFFNTVAFQELTGIDSDKDVDILLDRREAETGLQKGGKTCVFRLGKRKPMEPEEVAE